MRLHEAKWRYNNEPLITKALHGFFNTNNDEHWYEGEY